MCICNGTSNKYISNILQWKCIRASSKWSLFCWWHLESSWMKAFMFWFRFQIRWFRLYFVLGRQEPSPESMMTKHFDTILSYCKEISFIKRLSTEYIVICIISFLLSCSIYVVIAVCILFCVARLVLQQDRLYDVPRLEKMFLSTTSELKNNSRDLKNSVIIYAKEGTCSRYASEVLNRHNSCFYIHEPLQSLHFNDIFFKGVATIKKFLTCEFDQFVVHEIPRDKEFWLKAKLCHVWGPHYCTKFNVSIAQQECRSSLFKSIKEVQIRKIKYLTPLVDDGARVIMLIQDPRAVVFSKTRATTQRYPPGKGYEFDDASSYCHVMLRDLHYMRNRGSFRTSYLILRYEDLAVDPIKTTRTLYEYIGIPPDQGVLNLTVGVKRGRKQRKDDKDTHGMSQTNTAETGQQWRRYLSLQRVLQIQAACDKFMDVFGYAKIHTQDELSGKSQLHTDPRNLQQLLTHWNSPISQRFSP